MGTLFLQSLNRTECLLINKPVLRFVAGDMLTLIPWTDDALFNVANYLPQLVLVPRRTAHVEGVVEDASPPCLHSIGSRSIPPATTWGRNAIFVKALSDLPGCTVCKKFLE